LVARGFCASCGEAFLRMLPDPWSNKSDLSAWFIARSYHMASPLGTGSLSTWSHQAPTRYHERVLTSNESRDTVAI
jgi:hypothetical protein